MTNDERKAYEAWLTENNVPDYMRRLYNDDPIKIRDAMRKKREKELVKQAEEIKARKDVQGAKITEVYSESEEGEDAEASLAAPEETPEKGRTKTAIRASSYEEEDWESETEQPKAKKASLYGGSKKAEKKTKYYAEDAEKTGGKKNWSPRTKKILVVSVITVLSVLVLVLLIALIASGTSKAKLETAYITKGTLNDTGKGGAYVIRAADTVASPEDGIFVPKVEEGKKVEAGGVIGYITNEDNRSVVAKLASVKEQIVTLQNAEETAITSEELFESERKIAEQKNKLAKAAATGDFDGCEAIVEELKALIVARDEVLLATKTSNLNISELQQKMAEYEQIIDKKMIAVTAKTAGTVSYYVTGNENVERMLYENLHAGNFGEGFENLSLFSDKTADNYSNKKVSKDQIICRVVTQQDYYMVVESATDGAETLEGLITVANKNAEFESTGSVLGTYGNYVIISTMRSLKTSMPYELLDVEFNISSTSGYTVPVSALTDWDSTKKTARLAVVRANKVKFVYVGILAYDDKEAIITATPFKTSGIYDENGNPIEDAEPTFTGSDCYVVNAEKVKEGQSID